jgi:flagellin
MSFTINTNIASMNAQRNAGVSQNSLSTSLERLSSGLRVNSAKDDAAGLAIAERMNAQVRGMNVAVRNANDGISLAQTADGGLSSMADMIQRMRELAVQAVNATNTTGDINALQQEYGQLNLELSRTLGAVTFNNIQLFTTTANFDFQVGANSGQTIRVAGTDMNVSGMASIVAIAAGGAGSALVSSNSGNANNISLLDTALSSINSTRAVLGAVQSRFETTISFLKSATENQAAARGRIMDADFAQETSNLSRAQILQQAGTAMIAQANQLPQGVLALLR